MAVVEVAPATKQEWLDELVKRSAAGQFPAHDGTNCRYRDDRGRACAVGLLVPDSAYDYRAECEAPMAFLEKCGVTRPADITVADLHEVQRVHDGMAAAGGWDNERFVGALLNTVAFAGLAPGVA